MNNKIKFFLTVLSVLISVTPMATQVFIHRDNVVGLVIPREFDDLLNAAVDDLSTADYVNVVGVSFRLPVLSEAHIFLQNNTVKMIYTFTNPLDNAITLTAMDAEVICVDDNFTLGHVFIEPTPFGPKQTLEIPVFCDLSPYAVEHIAANHQKQGSIRAEFKNFSVDLIGVKIHLEHRKLGDIQIAN